MIFAASLRADDYDVILRHGRVLDGPGNPWARVNIGIRDDRIAPVGGLSSVRAGREIGASGLYVAPGFMLHRQNGEE